MTTSTHHCPRCSYPGAGTVPAGLDHCPDCQVLLVPRTAAPATPQAGPGLPEPVRAMVRVSERELHVLAELVAGVVAVAFGPGRERRSPEYRDGFRALLMRRATGRALACPFGAGEARADAWHAGVAEGRAAWRQVTGHLTAMGTLRDAVAHHATVMPRTGQHQGQQA